MSQIDDLIARQCPNGVEFRPLREVAHYPREKVDSSSLNATNFVGVDNLVAGKRGKVDATHRPNTSRVTQYRIGDVLIGNIRPYLKKIWLAKSFGGCSGDVLVVSISDEFRQDILPEFLYCLLSADSFFVYNMRHAKGAKMPRGNKNAVLEYRIPVPPLEVQREIVRILDRFTDLEAELEAELEARRLQYAHFWESLLLPKASWCSYSIGEVAQVFDGPHATPKKTPEGPWYLSISSLKKGAFDLTASAHLSEDQFSDWTRRVEAKRGDTMFSYETRIGEAAFWNRNEKAALGRRMGLLRPDPSTIEPKFLTLAYLGPQFQAVIRSKTVRGSTVERIPIARMADWPISLPTLQEQRRIVETLDNFDALTNDLSVGLPAELKARRKQYEYYRDRLLTFEELTV